MSKHLNQKEIYQKLEETKLLPLYTATDLQYLDILENLLVKYDLRFIEVTFRSDMALDAIQKLSQSGELIVGAGTVKTLTEAKKAIKHGAKFIVSPAIVPEVIQYCTSEKISIFPGVATPGDIQRAIEYGIRAVKFFPAELYGGEKAIKAFSGPFSDVKFLPTGGVDVDNFVNYLRSEYVFAVGGSFIISEAMLKKELGTRIEEHLSYLIEQI